MVHCDTDMDDSSNDFDIDSDKDPPYIPDIPDSSDSDSAAKSTEAGRLHQAHARPQQEMQQKPKSDVAATCESVQEPFERCEGIGNEKPNSDITVIMTNNAVRRQYDKVAFCYYCQKPLAKLRRHLQSKHMNEPEVAAYCLEDDKKDRELLKLRNLGNHIHNQKVIKEGKGDIIVRDQLNSRFHGRAIFREIGRLP